MFAIPISPKEENNRHAQKTSISIWSVAVMCLLPDTRRH